MATINLTDANFDETVSDGITLVDFWAEWCGPCKMIAPVLEELSDEYDGKAKIAKLDVDSNPVFSAKYVIRSIPTLMLFKDGEQLDVVQGAVPKQVLINKLNSVL